jgi:hypothetical protein
MTRRFSSCEHRLGRMRSLSRRYANLCDDDGISSNTPSSPELATDLEHGLQSKTDLRGLLYELTTGGLLSAKRDTVARCAFCHKRLMHQLL